MIKKEWMWMNTLNKNKMNLQELQEQIQNDLLTYFDDINLGGYFLSDHALDGMCDIIVNNFKRYERTNQRVN